MHGMFFIAMALAGQATVDESVRAKDADSQQKKWNDYYAVQAASYRLFVSVDPQTQLELKPEAVLYWSNPVRIGETNGAVFVWTRVGRAEAIGTVFSFLDRRNPNVRVISHSFLSLSLEPLSAERDKKSSWEIPRRGVQFKR